MAVLSQRGKYRTLHYTQTSTYIHMKIYLSVCLSQPLSLVFSDQLLIIVPTNYSSAANAYCLHGVYVNLVFAIEKISCDMSG